MMARVVLGIGSNINRRRHIQRGIEALRQRFGKVELSPVYRSESVGFEGPEFFNLVAIIGTGLAVDALHAELRAIEEAEGRSRAGDQLSSRTLDIDILLYDDAVLRTNGYDIPRGEILR
jgi:2-amino-4-hydroxy-6-hydroxymethyldihydropteridine diphosphokinase